jgi:DNA-binding transcriptional ArsR family regulator
VEPPPDEGELALDPALIKLLSSDTRIEILRRLGRRQMTLSELAHALDLNKTTVLEHLERLAGAGLVVRREGARVWVYYALTRRGEKLLDPTPRMVSMRLAEEPRKPVPRMFLTALVASGGVLAYVVFLALQPAHMAMQDAPQDFVNSSFVGECQLPGGAPCADADFDGARDDVDDCPGVPNAQVDLDGDGRGDACQPLPLFARLTGENILLVERSTSADSGSGGGNLTHAGATGGAVAPAGADGDTQVYGLVFDEAPAADGPADLALLAQLVIQQQAETTRLWAGLTAVQQQLAYQSLELGSMQTSLAALQAENAQLRAALATRP